MVAVTIRPHIASDPAALPRPSARVATVAKILECDPSDVRRMIRKGDLEAHVKGVRGVRVFLDSVADYQARLTIKPSAERTVIHKSKPRSAPSTAAFRAAMAGAKAKGIV